MDSSPCSASTQKRMRRPEPVRRAARAAAADSLLDRRLPDLRTQAARLDRLSSCAAMTIPNGVLLEAQIGFWAAEQNALARLASHQPLCMGAPSARHDAWYAVICLLYTSPSP